MKDREVSIPPNTVFTFEFRGWDPSTESREEYERAAIEAADIAIATWLDQFEVTDTSQK